MLAVKDVENSDVVVACWRLLLPVTVRVPLWVALPEVKVPKLAVCAKRFVDDAVVEKRLVEVAAVSKVLANRVVDKSCAPLVALKKPPIVVEAVTASEPEVVAEPVVVAFPTTVKLPLMVEEAETRMPIVVVGVR